MESTEQKHTKKRSLAGWLAMIVGGIVVLFILVLLIAPIFLKGKLVEIAKREINKNLNATVDFDGAKLTFFRSFPALTLDLKNFSMVNNAPFDGDTLFYSDAVSLTLDVLSLLRDEPLEIKRIDLINPLVTLRINEIGMVNWDITLPESSTEDETELTDEDPYVLNLRSVRVHNGKLKYLDRESDMDILARGLNGSISGRFSENEALLTTEVSAEEFDFVYENFAWLKNVKVNYQAIIDADFVNSIYLLKQNMLYLNDLAITADGSFGFIEEAIVILLTFESTNSDFKSILSLIPAVYARDFDKVQTSGKLDLKGSIKGNYSEAGMPGFYLALQVDDATFSYQGLPSKFEQINIKMNIDNSTGVPDATIVDLSKFDFMLDNSPFRAKMHLRTPVSNPTFDASMNGQLNLQKLSQAMLLEDGDQMSGALQFDVSMKANKADIENSNYEKITAMGSMVATDLSYNSTSFGMPVNISRAQMNFAPAYIDLVGLAMRIGESDMQFAGRVHDYLSYFVGDGILKGNLDLKSSLLDANALMAAMKGEPETEVEAEDEPFSLDLPERIDFVFKAEVEKLLYEQYELKNTNASMHYKDKRLVFDPLSADLLEGRMQLKGFFDAVDSENPLVDFEFGIQKFDIPLSYHQIGMLQQLAPVAERTAGDFSTNLKMRAKLNRDLNPVYESILGNGTLQTSQLVIQATDVFGKIADLMGNDEYKRLVTDGLNFSYEFVRGRVFQKPVTLSYAGSDVVIGGSVGFDQSIDYELLIQTSFGKLGSNISSKIQDLVNQSGSFRIALNPDTRVNVIARLSGDVRNPKIELDYSNFGANLRSSLEEQAKQLLEQKKEEVMQKISEEAEQIMAQAQEQAAELMQKAEATVANLRNEALVAAERIRSETDTQAARVVAEGKQRGPVAELAANETARRMRNEGNNTAQKLIDEADKRAQDVLQQAQQQSDQIIKNAQDRVDRLQ